jgi:KUP system potassium uptake protein
LKDWKTIISKGTSTRQKINTKSSTEGELVAVNDVLPQVLWTKYFLEAQGYGVTDNVIYQDNQSAMLLENNGRASSSKRTRHLNIRYFFIHDRISAKEVRVEYCPTEEMVADFFSKPLQGSLFRKFRDFIMNISSPVQSLQSDPLNSSSKDHRSVLEPEITDDGWKVHTNKRKQKLNNNKKELSAKPQVIK